MSAEVEKPCDGCGAPIVWMRTAKGASMPCNAKIITVLTLVDGKTVRGRESHWGTCPQRELFKRPAGEPRSSS